MKVWKHDIVCISKLEDTLNRMQKENKKIEEVIPYSFGNEITYPLSETTVKSLDCVMIIYTEEN